MIKNIFKKLIVIVVFGFILFSSNFVLAEDAPMPTVNYIIRNGETIIWQGEVSLPTEGEVIINTKNVNSRSVLAVLDSIDQASESFAVSNLQYYDSFGSFYLKCITPSGGSELCENWQYAVGSVSPWTSIDTTTLSGGETVGIYFGTSHRVSLNNSNLYTGDTLSATSEKYNYEDNGWEALTGVSIGVTLPNPSDEWNPTVVSSTLVDESGVANIVINDANTYTVGIVEDYYIPSYQVVVSNRPSSGSSGSRSYSPIILEEKSFSLEEALIFLKDNQKEDGSFEGELYTDWVAIGIADSGDEVNSIKEKIYDYLKKNKFESEIVTDNERHAMALMSLGINPYSGTEINYINKIASSFDGEQIGDKTLYNDDIFALIVLPKVGYTKDDEIIQKIISYTISKQSSDGSWGSVDMTSAGIQALYNFKDMDKVEESIKKAEEYLLNLQKEDGSWENISSTSWAIQALSLNESYNDKVEKAVNYLKGEQQEDGSLAGGDEIDSRIWMTSYAIPAILKLSWSEILESFPKEEIKITEIKEEASLLITQENKKEFSGTKKAENKREEVFNDFLPADASLLIPEREENPSLIEKAFKGFWGWLISLI
jgi:hypothetical protein